METPNTEILRTRVDIFVLNAVSNKDGYGYDILNHIQIRTEGHYEMKQSSVYNVLKRLETQGYISSYQGDESNGGKRRYYSITELGKEYLNSQKKEWEYSRTLIDNLISDRPFDLQNETPPFKPSDLRPFTPRKPKNKIIDDDINVEKSAAMVSQSVNTLVADASDDDIDEIVEPKLPKISTLDIAQTVASSITSTIDVPKATEKEIEDESYKILFEEIFANNEKKNDDVKDIDTTIDCKHINDLRMLLNKEGHKINTYAPSSNKNYMRYLMTAKLYRDLSLLSYLFFVLMLLVLYLAKNSFSVNNKLLLSFGCVTIIVPIICLIQYFANPNKRKKDNVRLNVILPACIVTYIAFLLLNIIIELLIPRGYSINSSQIYAPSIIALVIPFFGILFTVLYKSNLYHQKIK